MPETIEFAYPCTPTARITQPFGARPEYYSQFFVVDWDGIRRRLPGHEGTDYGLPIGSDIYSCLAGQVTDSYTAGNYGTQVRVVSGDFRIVYAHLSESLVSIGDTVSKGQLIAKSGNSGNSSGPHVHVTVKLLGASQAGITNFPGDIVNPSLYIKLPAPPVPTEGIKAYITAIPYLNVRSGKSTVAPILGTVPYDAAVTLLEPTTDVPLIGVAGEWIKVLTDKGLIGYCAAGYLRMEVVAVTRAIGYDISHHQTVPITEQQWKDSGAAFLIARASYSLTGGPGIKKDASYLPHIASARAAKLLIGSYHYLTRFESGATQARFFVESANAAGELDLPLWADVEDAGLTEKIVREFCEECDRLTGKVTGIYTRRTYWEPVIGRNLAWAAHRPLWIAQYPATYSDASVPSALPDTWAAGNWTLWQWAVRRPNFYSSNMDHNVFNGTNSDIWDRYGTKPVPVPTLEQRVASLELRVEALEARLNTV